ncbi:F-box-like domain-containing protein [Microdochium nivale]|nr:F-box-like domain-containing protein [Microdochium nivale]
MIIGRAKSLAPTMPAHLPSEVLTHILSYLLIPPNSGYYDGTSMSDRDLVPDSITLSRVSRASRDLRHVAEPLLYRHLHKASPALLQTLCDRPKLGEYVRHVSYHGWTHGVEACAAVEKLLHERIRGIMKAKYRWHALDWFLEHMLDGGIDAELDDLEGVKVNAQTVLLTLVLCLAPRVEVLNLAVNAMEGQRDTLSGLFEVCGRHVLGATRKMRKSGSAMPMAPLFSLCELRLQCWTSHGEPAPIEDRIYQLSSFPLLERLEMAGLDWVDTPTLGLEGETDDNSDNEEAVDEPSEDDNVSEGGADDDDNFDPDDETWPLREVLMSPGSHKNMTHLALRGCNPVTFSELREMLLVFPSLDTLVLEFWMFECREAIDLTQYGRVLREFGGVRLRRFDLEPMRDYPEYAEEEDEGAIGPLRDHLMTLEQLRVPLTSLVGADRDDGDDFDLCAYLPATLQWFWTEVTATGDADAHYRALARMLDEAGSGDSTRRLPGLEWVMVDVPRGVDGPEFEPRAFDVLRVSGQNVLYRKTAAAPVRTPPGWDWPDLDM